MLRFLRVSHLAVIDSVEVEFDAGLNILTGETGAGKSILVEAVGLLLGGRASGDLVRTGEATATIEAIFESGDTEIAEIAEIIVRREITAQGRSRAFINGALVTAGALKDLAANLIEIHGQREHQTLLDPSTHLGVLDAYGQLEKIVAPVRAAFETMRASGEALARLRRAMADRDARVDLLTFQLNELDRANLRASAPREKNPPELEEDDELIALRQVLANAERVERLCEESYSSLYESDAAILAGLGHVWRRVSELAALDPKFQAYVEARDGIKAQLEDLALFLRRYADAIEASPARLQQVEERLALLERLKRKYGPTLGEVVARRDALRRELEDLQQGDDRIAQLDRDYRVAREHYLAAARALGEARRRAAGRFAQELERLLAELAMERTRFEVRFAAAETVPDESLWTGDGIDVAEFFVSPNIGEDLRPLARIVSGGELSRIMLAIKTLTFGARVSRPNALQGSGRDSGSTPDLVGNGRDLDGSAPYLVGSGADVAGSGADVAGSRPDVAGSRPDLVGNGRDLDGSAPDLVGSGADVAGSRPDLIRSGRSAKGTGVPGLIFDEVDAGIGGRVADVVGRKLHALGSAFQVLCITHLPQIAAYADTHFQIDKRVDARRTSTTVRRLDSEARVDEIARMLGGSAITDGLRASAREMLGERAGRKAKGESERAKAKSSKKHGA